MFDFDPRDCDDARDRGRKMGGDTLEALIIAARREVRLGRQEAVYPAHMEIRRVSTAGTFRLQSRQPFLSHALGGEAIGLEAVGDGIWNIVYYRTLLGKIDERTARITGSAPASKV